MVIAFLFGLLFPNQALLACSLESFILPLMSTSQKSIPKPNSQVRLLSPQSFSVVGQAPATAGNGDYTDCDADMDLDFDEEDLDTAIRRTYKSLQRQDPKDVIMLEKLDESYENNECSMNGKSSVLSSFAVTANRFFFRSTHSTAT
jgi:hypothetical protein